MDPRPLPEVPSTSAPATRAQAPQGLGPPARDPTHFWDRRPDPSPPAHLPASSWTRTASKRVAEGGLEPIGGAPGVAGCGGGEHGARPPGRRRRTCCEAAVGGGWGGAARGSAGPSPRAGAPPSPGPNPRRAPAAALSPRARDRRAPSSAPKPTNPGAWPPPGPRRLRLPRGPALRPRRAPGGGETRGRGDAGAREAERRARARAGNAPFPFFPGGGASGRRRSSFGLCRGVNTWLRDPRVRPGRLGRAHPWAAGLGRSDGPHAGGPAGRGAAGGGDLPGGDGDPARSRRDRDARRRFGPDTVREFLGGRSSRPFVSLAVAQIPVSNSYVTFCTESTLNRDSKGNILCIFNHNKNK